MTTSPIAFSRPARNQNLSQESHPTDRSVRSAESLSTVQHRRLRSLSNTSLSSHSSFLAPPRSRSRRDSTPSRSSVSYHSTRPVITSASECGDLPPNCSRRTSIASSLNPQIHSDTTSDAGSHESRLPHMPETETETSLYKGAEESIQAEDEEKETLNHDCGPTTNDDSRSLTNDQTAAPSAFKRWVSTLRRRNLDKPQTLTPRRQRWTLDDFDVEPKSTGRSDRFQHRKSTSHGSSLAFVTAIRSATATLASGSASFTNLSRRDPTLAHRDQRGSLLSGSEPRASIDTYRSIIDRPARSRSFKRREKLEELVRTEEGYVADLKALSNAYFTILGQHPTTTGFARLATQRNIAEILRLHEDLLGELFRIMPFAEYRQQIARLFSRPKRTISHTRWHSVDIVPPRSPPIKSTLSPLRSGRRSLNFSRSSDDDHWAMRCDTELIITVVKAMTARVHKFALYEEYGATYDLVLRDIEEMQRSIADWPDYDRAIEAISIHVNPVQSHDFNCRKAMTLKDLLIKPIQRLPRYELLFADLYKLTPVCDDPESNGAVQSLLSQLNACCQRTNQARHDPARARSSEITWLMSDRLTFSDQIPKSIFLQLLGRVHLCGCLFVVHRSKDRVKGSYLICVLFESTLLLSTAQDDQIQYYTLAGIPLANTTIAECDNGRGMQCYTTPHSWKLVFEHSARMYKIVLTACSAMEADVWKKHLGNRITAQAQAIAHGTSNVLELQSPLIADMRSIGKAFGKSGSFVRRMSVHRTATVGPTSDLSQIIIKNTQATKEVICSSSTPALQIPRSQSVASPSHVQTLAPRRVDRVRLETLLSDVWTKDLIPYPGIVPRRSDPLRASANSVIRKFSMASITSNFSSSKRTASYTSIERSRKEDINPRAKQRSGDNSTNVPHRTPIVDFHNAPEAFLPADFELKAPKRKQSALRSLTMTMERPFSPMLGGDAISSLRLRRARSVRDKPGEAHISHSSSQNAPGHNVGAASEPVYSILQEPARAPAKLQKKIDHKWEPVTTTDSTPNEALSKTPKQKKNKSKLLKFFS